VRPVQITKTDIPDELSKREIEEKMLEAAKRKMRNEGHTYMQVNVVTYRGRLTRPPLARLVRQKKANIKPFKIKKFPYIADFDDVLTEAYVSY
jgi:hypothetical protein